jgi:cytochrome P450
LPFTGQLLALRDPVTQQPLSLQQLKSELVIATLAGFETTSNALSWTIGALAAHPHAMAALEQVSD